MIVPHEQPRDSRQMRTFPAQGTPHKYAAYLARVIRGSSACWLWPSQHARVPAFDMALAVIANRICARRIIGDNVSPLTSARAAIMVLSPPRGSYGKPDARAPGSVSEVR